MSWHLNERRVNKYMAQLYFKYGSMNSGKSIEVLKTKHNYEEQGKNVLLFTSKIDTRSGEGVVASRIGIKSKAISIDEDTNIFETTKELSKSAEIACVLIDEAQFLKKKHVYQLARIVDELDIPVIAYGLKNDFQNKLFEGSKYLLILGDKLEEIKSICHFCSRKATMALRLDNGAPIYKGEQIQIGGNETYMSVCRKHYKNPPLK